MGKADVRLKAVVLLLLIYCFMYLPLFVEVLCWSLLWYALSHALSCFAIIFTRKREPVAYSLIVWSYTFFLVVAVVLYMAKQCFRHWIMLTSKHMNKRLIR